jgi:hypothetical protein
LLYTFLARAAFNAPYHHHHHHHYYYYYYYRRRHRQRPWLHCPERVHVLAAYNPIRLVRQTPERASRQMLFSCSTSLLSRPLWTRTSWASNRRIEGFRRYVRRLRFGRDINVPSMRRTRDKVDYSTYRQLILAPDRIKSRRQAPQRHVSIQGPTRLCNSSESASTS